MTRDITRELMKAVADAQRASLPLPFERSREVVLDHAGARRRRCDHGPERLGRSQQLPPGLARLVAVAAVERRLPAAAPRDHRYVIAQGAEYPFRVLRIDSPQHGHEAGHEQGHARHARTLSPPA